jgi:outer membrane immunogenic protein
MVYASGGWAYGHTKSSVSARGFGGVLSTSIAKDKSGWTAGAGFEYVLTDGITLKTEYLYLDLGRDRIASGTLLGVPLTLDEHTTATRSSSE